MVTTPSDQLTPKQVLGVENAEHRRELIRKVGVERLLKDLPHKILDQQGTMYQLLSIQFSEDLPDARVLKMRNPSIGVWHLERVENDIKTVKQALHWRNQDEEKTEVLT